MQAETTGVGGFSRVSLIAAARLPIHQRSPNQALLFTLAGRQIFY